MTNAHTFHPVRWLILLLMLLILTSWSTVDTQATPLTEDSIYLPIVAAGSAQSTSTPVVTPTSTGQTPTATPTTVPTTPTAQPTPNGGLTSEAKILAARQRGEIDEETALLYRVYAAFADARLPAPLVGDDTNAAPSLALKEAQARWDTLAPATQNALAPFRLPPSAEGSWLEQRAVAGQLHAASPERITWSTACKTDIYIKVWYQDRFPEDADDARQICDLVSGSIWIKLQTLFNRIPLSDETQVNSGGDNRLDLYLVPAKTQTVAYTGCDNTPAYVLINHNRWSKAYLAQTLMAAFLFSYDTGSCEEYNWLFKATATWSVDYLFADDQFEQNFADDFLNNTDLSLNTDLYLAVEDANGNQDEYEGGHAAYLWLFFSTHEPNGNHDAVRKIWEAAGNPNSLVAINDALGGEWFKRTWNLFSSLNWNRDVLNNYQQWDNLTLHTDPWTEEVATLDGKIDNSYALDAEIGYLAARTYHFQFTDPSVRSVYFINPFYNGAWPTAQVYALVKVEGKPWSYQYWTEDYGKGFCRDLKEERLEELVLVISNHEWKDRSHKLQPTYPPRLNITNVACGGWKVEGKVTSIAEGEQLNKSTTATTSFTFIPTASEGGVSNHPFFEAVEGSGVWGIEHSHATCQGNGSGFFTQSGKVYSSFFVVHPYATDLATGTTYQPGLRGYSGFAGSAREWPYTYVCPNGSEELFADLAWFQTDVEPVLQVKDDGKTITGKFIRLEDRTTSLTTTTWEWTMTALPPQ